MILSSEYHLNSHDIQMILSYEYHVNSYDIHTISSDYRLTSDDIQTIRFHVKLYYSMIRSGSASWTSTCQKNARVSNPQIGHNTWHNNKTKRHGKHNNRSARASLAWFCKLIAEVLRKPTLQSHSLGST